MAASFYSNETKRSASPFYVPPSKPDHVSDCSFLVARTSLSSRYLLDLIAITQQPRKRAASTNFTQSSSLTNRSSTISSH